MAKRTEAEAAQQDAITRGREAFRRRAWRDAYGALSLANEAGSLDAVDLEALATAAYLIGREGDFQKALERAHDGYRRSTQPTRAARCAFWLGLTLLFRGDRAQASGWLARCRRLIEDRDCAEHGYLLLPLCEQQLGAGDAAQAYATAGEAVAAAERFEDRDLLACARHLQGRALIRQARVAAGLALLDEAMVSVVADELSPIVTGLVYCSVIAACQQATALTRAREWTRALADWCERQPEMVAFTSTCLVHRAEVMQFHGAWPDAMAEAVRACERFSHGAEPKPPGAALYRQAEIHRLRGKTAAAEEAYREAAQLGCDPQPGLALLRMAQGRSPPACAALRRVLDTLSEPLQRAAMLPAYIEVLLSMRDPKQADAACRELEELARSFDTDVLQALAAQARGAIALAQGDARAALAPLRRAFELWQQAQAPYDAARVRVLLGMACRGLGDEDAARLELGAARAVFESLGAAPELARLGVLDRPSAPLTHRELQILRAVAAGKTNKRIAAELALSERTIDRHVSNILTKLSVPSRAAATAYAYDHKLI
jgi:ATP/maltotriose-dependent transcriptional regulator MalT